MKDHLKLLTPELRKKVEAKTRECLKIAEKHFKVKFEMPEIRYDIKSWVGGLAISPDFIMRLNLILLVENEEHYLATTVPHEVAHLINRRVNKPAPGKKKLMPHGKEWKEVMALMKVAPTVKHSYDVSSIEKSKKRKRKGLVLDRVARIMKQISRLTEDERNKLESRLEAFV